MLLGRAVGPSGLGEYALALALAVVVQGVVSFGFEDLVLARGPRAGGDSEQARAIYRLALRIRWSVGVALLALGVSVWAAVSKPHFGFASVYTLPFVFMYAGLNGMATLGAAVQACRRLAGLSSAIDAAWAFAVVMAYAALYWHEELTTARALLVLVAAQAVASLAYTMLLRRLIAGRATIAFGFGESAVFWLNGMLSIGVGKTSDVLAMRLAGASKSSVGLFNAAFAANQTASTVLVQGAGTMAYVGLGSVYESGDKERTAAAWRGAVVVAMLLSFPLLAICLAFPTAVLGLLYGPGFEDAAPALVALASLMVLARITGGGANQSMLFLAERQALVVKIRIACVAINLVLDVVAYQLAGILGVALASGFCGVLISVVEFKYARDKIPLVIPWGVGALCLLPFLVPAAIISALLPDSMGLLGQFGACFVAFAVGGLSFPLWRPLRSVELPESTPAKLRRWGGAA